MKGRGSRRDGSSLLFFFFLFLRLRWRTSKSSLFFFFCFFFLFSGYGHDGGYRRPPFSFLAASLTRHSFDFFFFSFLTGPAPRGRRGPVVFFFFSFFSGLGLAPDGRGFLLVFPSPAASMRSDGGAPPPFPFFFFFSPPGRGFRGITFSGVFFFPPFPDQDQTRPGRLFFFSFCRPARSTTEIVSDFFLSSRVFLSSSWDRPAGQQKASGFLFPSRGPDGGRTWPVPFFFFFFLSPARGRADPATR